MNITALNLIHVKISFIPAETTVYMSYAASESFKLHIDSGDVFKNVLSLIIWIIDVYTVEWLRKPSCFKR